MPTPAPPSAQSREVKAALKELARATKSGIVTERLAALEALSRHDDPDCVDALLELLEDGDVSLYPTVRRVLGAYTREKTVARLLQEGLAHRDPVVRAQVLVTLADARPATLDWVALTEQALDDPMPLVRAAAVRALGRARAGHRTDRVLELATDPAERVRAEVPAALARLAGERAQVALEHLVRDARWRVRLEAAQALADIKTPASVRRLVDALDRESGRLREDMLAMLERLTGRSFGADTAAWRAYIDAAPPDFLARGDRVALQRIGPPTYVGVGVRYYTISTASQRFVMLTDLSGSMSAPLPGSSAPSLSRLARTQLELQRLIGALDRRVAIDLVTFRGSAKAWKPQLVRMDDRTREAALREVADYRADGATDIHGALAMVFDMAERALDAELPSDEDLDTLFLLSDGSPSAGEIQDTALLLQYVAERNRVLRLRIHCISLEGETDGRGFLHDLAALGDGHCLEVSGTD